LQAVNSAVAGGGIFRLRIDGTGEALLVTNLSSDDGHVKMDTV